MELLTVPEAAMETRMSVSWWRQRTSRGEIKHLKIGSRVFIMRETIDELFEKGLYDPEREEQE
jgi:excisionase family DNA binding protein